jgi:hypothetical protein
MFGNWVIYWNVSMKTMWFAKPNLCKHEFEFLQFEQYAVYQRNSIQQPNANICFGVTMCAIKQLFSRRLLLARTFRFRFQLVKFSREKNGPFSASVNKLLKFSPQKLFKYMFVSAVRDYRLRQMTVIRIIG